MGVSHGSLNVPIFHITQPLDSMIGIWSFLWLLFLVMSNIPKMGHLTIPVSCLCSLQRRAANQGSALHARLVLVPKSPGCHQRSRPRQRSAPRRCIDSSIWALKIPRWRSGGVAHGWFIWVCLKMGYTPNEIAI